MRMRYGKTFRLIAVMLIMCLSVGLALPAGKVSAANSVAPETAAAIAAAGGYKLSAENNNLALYVDSSNGYFAVVNKSNNSVWYSVPEDVNEDKITKGVTRTNIRSHLVLQYIAVEDINTIQTSQSANSATACISKGGLSVDKITNGVKVTFNFVDLKIKIPVTYVLKDDYLEASIDIKGIDEGNKNRIIEVQFLPSMGAANQQQQGYLFVPDGCGAVAGFNRGIVPYKDYSKMVYGADKSIIEDRQVATEQDIRLPVFGTVIEGKGAMMGVITSGDGGAKITAKTGSAKQNYNMISSLFSYRIYSVEQSLYASKANGEKSISTVTNTAFGLDKYTVRYYFLSGDNASYVGMANRYRKYLTDEKALKKTLNKSTLSLNVYGSLETTANFLGFKYNKKRVLTSFDDTQSILKDLKKSGVDNISVQYIGWVNNGVYNRKYVKSASPLSVLGGKSDFNDLKEYLNKSKIEYYLGVDFINYSKSRWGVSAKSNAAHTTNGDVAHQYEYSIVTYEPDRTISPWVLISPASLNKASAKFIKDFKKKGNDSIGVLNIGSQVYSDFGEKNGVYRAKSVSLYENFLKGLNIKNIAVDGGNSYVLPYAERIYELPISSSKYDIFDYDVPFMQIVLHGYKNYTTPAVVQSVDPKTTYLKSLETGSDLLFDCTGNNSYNLRETRLSDLYSSKYSLWKKTAVNYYKSQKTVNDKIYDKEIVDHTFLGNDVFKTVYSDKTAFYVNYSEKEATVDGVTIKAKDFVLKEAAR